MAALVSLWAFAFLSAVGVGRLTCLLLGIERPDRLVSLFWLGLTLVVAWLFVAHIFAPLDSVWISVPVLIAAIGGWMIELKSGGSCFSNLGCLKSGGVRSRYFIPAAAFLVVLCLANLALSEPNNYDSFLYHFASIRHHSEYAAIEGLANLHFRLGFQTATIPLASLLDLWPFDGEGYRVVNGLLLSALVLELSSRVMTAVSRGVLRLGTAFLVVATPVYLLIPGSADPSAMIASPSLDTGAGVVFIVAFAYFIDALTDRSRQRIAVALTLLALAATFRQLNLVFLVTGGSLLLLLGWRAGVGVRYLARPILVAALLTLAAALHSTVISGYPFYPATFPNFNLPWAQPVAEAEATRDDITQFARGRTQDPIALGDSLGETLSWLQSWVLSLRESGQLSRLLLLAIFSLVGIGAVGVSRNRKSGLKRLALIMFPLLVVLVFWFVAAPLVRFGLGPLAAALSAPIALALLSGRSEVVLHVGRWAPDRSRLRAGGAILVSGLALILLAASFLAPRGGGLVAADGTGSLGSRAPQAVGLKETTYLDGVVLSYPAYRDWCGMELWCTPNLEPGLSLRGDELADGFERLPSPQIRGLR